MKISIITTVYKAERDLPRLLDSMMAHKSPELEFFLIDNGSPDRCGEICQEYAALDPRFTVCTLKENIGYIRARNLGIEVCNGDYVGFCDSDDYLEPGGYDRAVERLRKTQCDFYITAWRTISSSETINFAPYKAGVYSGQELLPQAFGPVQGKGMLHGFAWKQIFRRSILTEGQLQFMEELKPYEDQVFNIDMLSRCEIVCVDEQILYNYIVNEQSITAQLASNFDAEAEWNRIEALYREKNARVQEPMHREAMCNQLLQSLYTLALNMVKCKKYTVGKTVELFYQWEQSGLPRHISEHASKQQSLRLCFVRRCINKRQYLLLSVTISVLSRLWRR